MCAAENMRSMFRDGKLSVTNYDALLRGWTRNPANLPENIEFGAGATNYSAVAARAILADEKGWTITDGIEVAAPTTQAATTQAATTAAPTTQAATTQALIPSSPSGRSRPAKKLPFRPKARG